MSVGMRGGFNTGIGIVRIDADQRGELGLLRHDGRGIHVGLNLADPIGILGFALGEEGGDVGAEGVALWWVVSLGHTTDDREGHGGVACGGSEAGWRW
jgi:hypothetical protein